MKPNTADDLASAITLMMDRIVALRENDEKYFKKLSAIVKGVEIKLSYESILRSAIKKTALNFQIASRGETNTFLFCKAISRILQRLTLANAYNWTDDQLFSCSLDIFYKCLDWNMADMVYFIYQVRTNPFGRKEFVKSRILPSDLMNMIAIYNDMRALEHERVIRMLELQTN